MDNTGKPTLEQALNMYGQSTDTSTMDGSRLFLSGVYGQNPRLIKDSVPKLLEQGMYSKAVFAATAVGDSGLIKTVLESYAQHAPEALYWQGRAMDNEELLKYARPEFARQNPKSAFAAGGNLKDGALLGEVAKVLENAGAYFELFALGGMIAESTRNVQVLQKALSYAIQSTTKKE